ncbi:hypothetical protein Tco_1196769 [Tanacetum coccineum]
MTWPQEIPSAKLHVGNEMRHQKALIGQYNSRNDTRISKETHQQWEYCTKINVKEAHSSKELGLPRWQSVCSHFNPTAKIRDQMIEERKGQDQKERPRPRNFSLAL